MAAPLAYWDPEDRAFWADRGARIARRNLALSVPPLVLSFAIWTMWSMVVINLPHVGFRFSANQLFWLAAAPGLAGGTLRLLFSFAVPIFGGRRWTVISTLLLLVPAIGLALVVQDPSSSYPALLLVALAAGIGGGNFASSMAHVSMFYPRESKGTALGLAAGLGNLGITLAQIVVPLVVAWALLGDGSSTASAAHDATRAMRLANAGYVWVPLILLCALAAWLGMNDLDRVEAPVDEQAAVFVDKHTWLLAWLYLGTFGSLIGFAAGFPLVTETQFEGIDVATFAFIGPLAAAVARPVGGWLADRHGGARIALGCFAVMALAVAVLLAVPSRLSIHLTLFAVLFAASGIGNGAVFQLIPAVFLARACAPDGRGPPPVAVQHAASLHGAAALGIASAVAAFGGFFIPKAYGSAIAITGGANAALVPFFVFYVTCMAVTWWFYVRRPAAVQRLGYDLGQ